MTPLHCLALALVVPAALAAGYYWALAAVALARGPRRPAPAGPPRTRFAVVIPAHDEEAGIAATLRSCAALDYPPDLVRVVVIADNCTDATAAVARRHGAVVLERHDPDLRGKGHALAWGLPRVLADRPDAVVVIDADCAIDRHALRAFAARLTAGGRVLQARVATANPDAGPVSYAAAVGNVLENDLFAAPLDRLTGAAYLRGTGMVFARAVLEAHPWAAFSPAEDSEYAQTLRRAGVAVRWAAEVTVHSDAPTGLAQLRVQRRRWAAALAAPPARGRRGVGRWARLARSRPLVLGLTLVAAAAAGGCYWREPGPAAAALAAAGAAALALQGLYLLLGVVRLGVTPRRLRLLAGAPLVVVQLFGIAARSVAGAGPRAWVRTPRAESPAGGAA